MQSTQNRVPHFMLSSVDMPQTSNELKGPEQPIVLLVQIHVQFVTYQFSPKRLTSGNDLLKCV